MKKIIQLILILIICSIPAYAQPTWVTSGAAIGNESTFLYTENTTITFDGFDDEIDLSSSMFSTTDATQEYSFACWIKLPSSVNGVVIITQYLSSSTDTDQFEFFINGSGQIEYKKYITTIANSTTVVNDDNWHHVAFTKSSSGTIKLYIDAVEDGTGTDNLDYAASNTYIGAKDNSNFFNGKIDQVKIWNTTLSEIQIFNAMYGTYAPEANIIAVYDFEEGSGTTLTDVTSNTNDGTIAGTPVWNTNDEITTEVKIKDEKGDILTISNWGGTTNPDGVQIYKVNDTPNDVTTTGSAGTIIPGHYWGVFPANGEAPTYDLELMYNGYKTWSDESQLDLAYRTNNASGAWTSNLDVTLDIGNDKLTKSVADPSRNEYHLMYEIPPEPGNCLQFDGSDAWVSIPTNTAPNNWSAITTFTVELWIKPTAADACHIWEGATGASDISLEGQSSTGYALLINNVVMGNTGALTLNKWYHVTCSYDDVANEAKIYLDGVLKQTSSYSASSEVFGNFFYLADRQGGGYANNGRDFPGYIDELRIWDDVRTATEIQDHMHKEFSATELTDATTSNLMAYYNFNHFGNTTTVTDYKGNNNGTLKNNADNADGETTGPIWQESTVFNRWWGTDNTNWAEINNWSKGRIPITTDNIGIHQVKGTPDIVLNSAILATGLLSEVDDFTVGSSAIFTANAGEQFTVNDPFTINGTANFKSPTNLTASASLITKSTVQGSGITNAERYMTANNWHYFASPVDVQNSSQFVTTNLYSWDETIADSWNANDFINDIMGWTSFSGNFTPGTGYVAYETAAGTKIFSGNVNSGDQTINLNYTDNTATHNDAMFDGWNLIGNPYPSAIDWTSGNITKTNIDAAIYYYDDDGTANYNNYKYYVDGGGDDASYPAISANEGSQYIPAFQSVFVKANNSGASSILFTNACREHNTATNFYKAATKNIVEQEFIRFKAEKDGITDETVIRFLPEASPEYDGRFDAYKLFSTSEQVPQIYTITTNNNWLAISSLSEYNEETIIPIGFRSGTAGTCKITATELNFDEHTNIYLKDIYKDIIIDLKEIQTYEFETNNQNYYDRFQLVFKSDQTNINQLEINNVVSIYSHSNIVNVIINSENTSAKLEIYNILGQKIYQNNINSDNTKIQLNSPTGNYIVKLKHKGKIITKKVFINN